MIQIENAPHIREAERNGLDCGDTVSCPICGDECETFFVSLDDEVLGCENCVKVEDACNWMDDHKEEFE